MRKPECPRKTLTISVCKSSMLALDTLISPMLAYSDRLLKSKLNTLISPVPTLDTFDTRILHYTSVSMKVLTLRCSGIISVCTEHL